MNRYDAFLNGIVLAKPYNFKDKTYALQKKINLMLARLRSMFKWEGLPETIPERMLELYLLNNGHCVITPVQEKLYAFTGGFGGELDEYYRPTIYTVANPFLKFFENLDIGVNCVLCGNDSAYNGLLPLLEMYGSAMVENELSLQIADINSRIISLITADNDTDLESAKMYLKHISDGDISAIGESAFFDGVRTQPYTSAGANRLITDLIEYEQYLKASLYNEIGLNANYNMKRESLNSSESQLNNDALTPLIDDMLNMRKKICEEVNAKYGTNMSVELASAWKENEIESEAELEAITGDDPEENVSRETFEDPEPEPETNDAEEALQEIEQILEEMNEEKEGEEDAEET